MGVIPAAGCVGLVRLQVPAPTLVDRSGNLAEEPLGLSRCVRARGPPNLVLSLLDRNIS